MILKLECNLELSTPEKRYTDSLESFINKITHWTRHVESTSIRRRHCFNTSSTKFSQISIYFLCHFLVPFRSKYPCCFHVLFWGNFTGQKIHVAYTYFFSWEIPMDKKSTSLLVNLQANENISGDFPLLVTLISWLFTRLFSWTFQVNFPGVAQFH